MAHNLCYSTLVRRGDVAKLKPEQVTKSPTGARRAKCRGELERRGGSDQRRKGRVQPSREKVPSIGRELHCHPAPTSAAECALWFIDSCARAGDVFVKAETHKGILPQAWPAGSAVACTHLTPCSTHNHVHRVLPVCEALLPPSPFIFADPRGAARGAQEG
eukprot:3294701-Pleurochrysis_carterae.AAC.3